MDLGQRGLTTLAVFQPDEILKNAYAGASPSMYVVDGVRYTVAMRSKRYQLFNRSRVCACCGVVGTMMALETFDGITAHFNLYGERKDGSTVLLTKDHIVAQSRGGSDALDNLQVLCSVCNGVKGAQALDLRTLQRAVKNRLTPPKRDFSSKEQRILSNWKQRLKRAREQGLVVSKLVDDTETVVRKVTGTLAVDANTIQFSFANGCRVTAHLKYSTGTLSSPEKKCVIVTDFTHNGETVRRGISVDQFAALLYNTAQGRSVSLDGTSTEDS